jgi:hypothetical protein
MNVKLARAELALLRARYDSGAIPQSLYAVLRKLEEDISWAQFRQQQVRGLRKLQHEWSIAAK